MDNKKYRNGVLMTLSVVGNKWKPLILCHLIDGPMRPATIKKQVTGISPKVLTEQLRQLETEGIIFRKVFSEVPPHVEYSITEYGKTLGPVLAIMAEWGEKKISIMNKMGNNISIDFVDHKKYLN